MNVIIVSSNSVVIGSKSSVINYFYTSIWLLNVKLSKY